MQSAFSVSRTGTSSDAGPGVVCVVGSAYTGLPRTDTAYLASRYAGFRVVFA